MSKSFQLFNLDTMSGVFPGTRTMVFQRLRLRPAGQPAAQPRWARLLWYADPLACVVELDSAGEPGAAVEEQPQRALLRIPDPQGDDFGLRLQAGLQTGGWQLQACGGCALWQPLVAKTSDGLAAGCCTWATGQHGIVAPNLTAQSLLALDCIHWQPAGERPAAQPEAPVDAAALEPIGKRADRETDERWTWWGRLRRQFAPRAERLSSDPAASWEDKIVERSGLGAGTERCFACQGRIANLGALAVASPEGDKQTFSVWRCRLCFTYYLNNWIDRWERTDSLETEETYYRLAPQEALEILAVIDGVVDAEHPARRHERDAERLWMLHFIGERVPLSHQIKQGR